MSAEWSIWCSLKTWPHSLMAVLSGCHRLSYETTRELLYTRFKIEIWLVLKGCWIQSWVQLLGDSNIYSHIIHIHIHAGERMNGDIRHYLTTIQQVILWQQLCTAAHWNNVSCERIHLHILMNINLHIHVMFMFVFLIADFDFCKHGGWDTDIFWSLIQGSSSGLQKELNHMH